MENAVINVEEIMMELKEKAAKRKYEKEAVDFESLLQSEDDGIRPFYLDDLNEELRNLQEQCYVEYEQPVTGKGKFIKKIIKKSYCFHMKPLWEAQNALNVENINVLCQIRDYIAQQKENEDKIQILENKCKQLERKLAELEGATDK